MANGRKTRRKIENSLRKWNFLVAVLLIVIIILAAFLVINILRSETTVFRWAGRQVKEQTEQEEETEQSQVQPETVGEPYYDVQLLTVNEYSRPGLQRDEVNDIVVHYTANPGTSAQANRNYFENLKDSQTTKASAHFIIGIDGELIQCIPTAEIAYACSDRNSDTVSIECCYNNEDGSFEQATYDKLVQTVAWLCDKFDLTYENVIRHYDVNGKDCPKYYVEHEDAWQDFLQDVKEYQEKYF